MKHEFQIQGIEFKPLVTQIDSRGYFRELIRCNDPFFKEGFGQWSQSFMYNDIIKAWHFHKIQTDYFYVASGVLRIGLCDLRKDSSTYKMTMDFLMGDHQPASIMKVPPGIAHGVKTIQGPVQLFYITSHVYNPEDEIRIPYNDPEIKFDWLAGPPIR
jgi:dTDP-4-dehydrorhamnose 3,5-epimerase